MMQRAKYYMDRINYFIPAIFMVGFLLVSPVNSYSQDGKQLFEKNCAVCHHIGQGKLVGPDLEGITQRRDIEWLKKFIHNSQEFIKSGDPIAVQVYEEYNKALMPAFTQFSDAQITSIIDYIHEWKPAEVAVLTVDPSKRTGFSHDEYLRGERLFHGLIPLEQGDQINCSNCHNTITSDTLNWSPSVIDLALAFMDSTAMNIYQSMNQPVSERMEQAHKGIKMNEQEIYYISAYLSHMSDKTLAEHKIFPTRLMLFLLFGFLMTLALIDLIFTRKIKYRAIHVGILIIGLSVHGWIAYYEATQLGRTEGYAPNQPIKFSHLIHAGQNKTDCRYCHFSVEYSKAATIPSVNVCMNCHNVVKTGTNSGNFEIKKIERAILTGTPVEWIKVHYLPDHAYFNHAQHVKAGKVACEKCHGKVEEMHILRQESNLSMGFCVNCHRETEVDMGNKYYSTFKKENKIGGDNRATVDNMGGIDCMKCHY